VHTPSRTPDVTPERIQTAVARLASAARPSRIIVFGSAARGTVGPHSDLDLLVVMPHAVPDWHSESVRLRRMLAGTPMAIDILVVSEAEAAAAATRQQGIISHALRHGVVMYEAPQ